MSDADDGPVLDPHQVETIRDENGNAVADVYYGTRDRVRTYDPQRRAYLLTWPD